MVLLRPTSLYCSFLRRRKQHDKFKHLEFLRTGDIVLIYRQRIKRLTSIRYFRISIPRMLLSFLVGVEWATLTPIIVVVESQCNHISSYPVTVLALHITCVLISTQA